MFVRCVGTDGNALFHRNSIFDNVPLAAVEATVNPFLCLKEEMPRDFPYLRSKDQSQFVIPRCFLSTDLIDRQGSSPLDLQKRHNCHKSVPSGRIYHENLFVAPGQTWA